MPQDNPLSADLAHILDHTEHLWEELRGKRIFITGGTGFFGCWLLESFIWANERLKLGATAVVLTRQPAAFKSKVAHLASHPAICLHQGDIRSFLFPPGTFSHVIHSATDTNGKTQQQDPLLLINAITEGTLRTLEFARCSGAEKFLITSSGAVYGTQPWEIRNLTEDHTGGPDPTNPTLVYGESKRLAELMCCVYAKRYELHTTIARCFAFVGPYMPLDAHFAIGNFILDGLRGGPIEVRGDGTPYRSYLYAADLVIWLWHILFRGKPLRAYNVGSDVEVSIAELARTVAGCFQPISEVHIATQPD